MLSFKHALLSSFLSLAALFAFSCSDSGGETIKKTSISGVLQKGPFVEGSVATLYELEGDLSQTGRIFEDIIANSRGSFEIKNIELVSPYAILKASGYYRNENTGELSAAPITLFAIADIREKDQINVNILTHLEYPRVLDLVEKEGISVTDAKKQAQKEIFAAFGIDGNDFKSSEDMSIFGDSESDAALLAISVLLQGDLAEAAFSQRLTNLSQAIKNGEPLSEELKADMAKWAAMADGQGENFCMYGKDPDNCWIMPTDDLCQGGKLVSGSWCKSSRPLIEEIKTNILSWDLSSEVPAFEKYIYDYWTANSGLGVCNSETQDKVEGDYICRDGFWKYHNGYVPCNSETQGKIEDYSYVCKNGVWEYIDNIHTYCLESNECIYNYCLKNNNCSTFTDPRDGTTYQTATIGNLTFMLEHLKYRGEYGELGQYPCTITSMNSTSAAFNAVCYSLSEAQVLDNCPDGWRRMPAEEEMECMRFGDSSFDEECPSKYYPYFTTSVTINCPYNGDNTVIYCVKN